MNGDQIMKVPFYTTLILNVVIFITLVTETGEFLICKSVITDEMLFRPAVENLEACYEEDKRECYFELLTSVLKKNHGVTGRSRNPRINRGLTQDHP